MTPLSLRCCQLLLSLFIGSQLLAEEEKEPNRLANEKSPYLLQHVYNPVDWYPWGEEAFAKAREEEKPILLSVGYSTCHWCHVMERESFTNEEVANFLNEHFVSIKLDREERPDVDAVYMKSFQALTGEGGGWPLNVFLTNDLKLFFGGTYFPPESGQGRPSFMRVLEGVNRAWKEDHESVLKTGNQLASQLHSYLEEGRGKEGELTMEVVERAVAKIASEVDPIEGGWGQRQKFPQPSHLMLLLTSDNAEAREKALLTCRKMAAGGIHDHLGGGFHRYTTDAKWLVPHFEKMLYDQAQLLEVYCEAWRLEREAVYRDAAKGIADYVLAEMTHASGAFYSAQDAQSEGKEGKYWCWTTAELKELLKPAELEVVTRVYGLTERGNFYDSSDPDALKNQNVLSIVREPGEDREVFDAAVMKIKAARAKRVPPATDDKVLAGWNGLMVAALAEAGMVFEEPRYLAAAEKAFLAVEGYLWDGKRLANRWREGDVEDSQQATNYLAMARAGRQLYEATLEAGFLEKGLRYLDGGRARFYDQQKGGFFDGEERDDLVLRLKDDYDSAMPTASSLGTRELVWYAEITDREDLKKEVDQTLAYFGHTLREEPFSLPGMARALAWTIDKPSRLVLAGEGDARKAFLQVAWQAPGGSLIVMGNEGLVSEFTRSLVVEEGVLAFLCKGMSCREPTDDPAKISAWLLEKDGETAEDE